MYEFSGEKETRNYEGTGCGKNEVACHEGRKGGRRRAKIPFPLLVSNPT